MKVKFCRVSLPLLKEFLCGRIQPTHFYTSNVPQDLEVVKIEQHPVDMLNGCMRVICTSSSFEDITGETEIPEFEIVMRIVDQNVGVVPSYRDIAVHKDHKLECRVEKGKAVLGCVFCESTIFEAVDPLSEKPDQLSRAVDDGEAKENDLPGTVPADQQKYDV